MRRSTSTSARLLALSVAMGLLLGSSAGVRATPSARQSETEPVEPTLMDLVSADRLPEIRGRIAAGAPPESVLNAASKFDSAGTVELAFELGADPKSLRASLALVNAERFGHARAADALRRAGVDLEGRDEKGRTALIWAAGHGRVARLRAILQEEIDLDATSNIGRTALMEAVLSGRRRKVRAILRHHPDIDAVDRDGWTALFWAVRAGEADLIGTLVARRPNLNHVDRLGWTPLQLACWQGETAAVRQLLSAGANPSLGTPSVGTPLIRAVQAGNAEVVRLLVSAGVDRAPKLAGRDAAGWAAMAGRLDLVELLASGSSQADSQ